MKPISFPEQQKVLGAPAGWDEELNGPCVGLPVAIVGGACMSVWEPTPDERAKIAAGDNIVLSVMSGQTQPPVSLNLYPASGTTAAATQPDAMNKVRAFEEIAAMIVNHRIPCEARGRVIYAGTPERGVALGEVYDNGNPDPEIVAKIWAASCWEMFPVLGLISDTCRAASESDDLRSDVTALFRAIADLAAKALPVPTAQDVKEAGNG